MWIAFVVILLLPYLGVMLTGRGIGAPELMIWSALIAAWVVLFFTWARRPGQKR